jgi:hypothetical protein
MSRRATSPIAHLLLAVMLMTFLAPGFGWHAHATHEEIAHSSLDRMGSQHHEHDADTSGHDDEAHGVIGHLLGHLPAFASDGARWEPTPPPSSEFREVIVQWPRISPEPPLRPPRFS